MVDGINDMITVEDVRNELARCIEQASKERGKVDYSLGLTAPEIADRINRGVHWTRRAIRRGLEQGSLIRDRAKRVTISGITTTVPVYRASRITESDQ